MAAGCVQRPRPPLAPLGSGAPATWLRLLTCPPGRALLPLSPVKTLESSWELNLSGRAWTHRVWTLTSPFSDQRLKLSSVLGNRSHSIGPNNTQLGEPSWSLSRKRQSHWALAIHSLFHLCDAMMASYLDSPSLSDVLAWRIPGTGEPGGLPSMGLHRVGHDWSDAAAAAAYLRASLGAQRVKHLPVMGETQVRSLGQEDALEKEMAIHSSTLAWRIPWTEEPGGLQSTGSQSWTRRSDFTSLACLTGTSQVAVVVKNPAANAGDIRDMGSTPWLGGSPQKGYGTHSNIFLAEEFQRQMRLACNIFACFFKYQTLKLRIWFLIVLTKITWTKDYV